MWVVFGLVLAAIEMATPGGFFIIFFGISAVIIGLLEGAGVITAPWLQWLLFTVIALGALRLFRRPLLALLGPREGRRVDSLIGEVALAATDIAPGQHGRAELRGASWQARNVASAGIAAGARTRVVAVDGLTLDVRPE